MVDNYNVAITGQAEWYPVAYFLRDDNGEVGRFARRYLGGLDTRQNACRGPASARPWPWQGTDEACGTLCRRAWLHRFQARPFYEKLGYRVFGTLENHPAGHQHHFMTKQL
jgi:hypothetical protein